MASPYPITVTTTVDLGSSPSFVTNPFKLNDATYGKLDTGKLGEGSSNPVNISSQVLRIKIGGGYNLFQDTFDFNNGYIRVYDPNGWWNPQNINSPYYPNLTPGKKIIVTATYSGTTYNMFSGYIYAYNYSFPENMNFGYVDLMVADGFRLLNLVNISTITGGVAGQTTGQRINSILDAVGFPTSLRNIDTGDSTVQADPGTQRQCLPALKNVAFVEQGALYMNSAGKVNFLSRTNLMKKSGAAPITYFSNDGSAISYAGIKFAHDDKLVVNSATVKNVGGTAQTYTDAASTAAYFPHAVYKDNVVGASDADALNMARVYVQTRKDTTIRIDSISLDLTTPDYAAGIVAGLGLDIMSTVNIRNVQGNGSVITKTLQVVGSNYDITPNTFDITFTTSEPLTDGFILNSSLYGILNTSPLGW